MDGACDHERLFELYLSRRWSDNQAAIAGALRDPHADAVLAAMLDASANGGAAVFAAAFLGDLQGEAGTAALRRAVTATGRGSRDVRCAALLALAKRSGPDATPWLRDGLAGRDRVVREYALIGLAGAGDDRAWGDVFSLLPSIIRPVQRSRPSAVATALAYLACHVEPAERRHDLVALVRKDWGSIAEDAWFAEYWPEVRPGGPPPHLVPPPDVARIRGWARALFRPVKIGPMFE